MTQLLFKSLFLSFIVCVMANSAFGQKGTAEPDWYPLGYDGSTWTGEVTAFDDQQRTLTLTHMDGKKAQTFIASIPDEPFQWIRDSYNSRVLEFAYDKKAKSQTYVYVGPGRAATILPENSGGFGGTGNKRWPNPPPSDDRPVLSMFMGRRITVFYTKRERKEGDQKIKYNDVWRIRVEPAKK